MKPPRRRFRQYPDLATYLKESGDSQVNLAAKTGTTQAHISRIVKGENIPRAELLLRIARYANIPPDSFMRVYMAARRSSPPRRVRRRREKVPA